MSAVRERLQSLVLSDDTLSQVKMRMRASMDAGLGQLTNDNASIKMLPSFVRSTPDGTERGEYLALDLGGTNFRVLLVKITDESGQQQVFMENDIYLIPEEVMVGTAEQLFDLIAKCLSDFLEKRDIKSKTLPLAFTFSFPCKQTKLDESTLLTWTKGFKTSGVEGRDIVQLLREAIKRRGDFDIDVVAVVNDTVGTMMTCGYDDQRCEVGLIVGTGTNVCYMEELSNVELVEGDEGRMCINTEWGAFGDDGALNDVLTEFDHELDRNSINAGKQRYEKMVSGMYLGEIVRLVLVKLTEEGLLFGGKVSPKLGTKGSFETRFVSAMEKENVGLQKAEKILKDFGLQVSAQDCEAACHICCLVSTRSAHLCAAGLATVLTRIRQNQAKDRLQTTVGVDGSVYKLHPQFSHRLQDALKHLVPECEVRFLLSEDGSGKGAAMVTAVAYRLAQQRRQICEQLKPFKLSNEKLRDVQRCLRKEMELGLKCETQSLKMLPTYVYSIPDGNEEGEFLTLDVGGGNFIVMLVKLPGRGQHEASIFKKIYSIPENLQRGTAEQLFDHLAKCAGELLRESGRSGQSVHVGFVFSFPFQQCSLEEGKLIAWTKAFWVTACEGKDIVSLLKEAIHRRQEFEAKSVVLINDTVATMMSVAYTNPDCQAALIVGTGFNVCYMEELDKVELVKQDGSIGSPRERAKGSHHMCVNVEPGDFWDETLLRDLWTDFDMKMDKSSLNPGKQRFEKMISGMYLGEIVRNILIDLTEKGLLFRGVVSQRLCKPDIFETRFLSYIESDRLALLEVRSILRQLGLDSTCDDSLVVKEVCHVVSRRAAQLCGATIAAMVEKMREDRNLQQLKLMVGVDGTMYKLHPSFSHVMEETVRKLAKRCLVTFRISEDGSGKGAALIAASRLKPNSKACE